MPRTLGVSNIHISKINTLVPVDYALHEAAQGIRGDLVTEKIADHVASLIPNGT